MSEENLNITTTNKYNASLESEKELKELFLRRLLAPPYGVLWNPRRN
jgi:hypothetical protein